MPEREPLIDASFRELRYILEWIAARGDADTVLIGGWAVQVYNPWYGSIDIDLVMRGRTRDTLLHHLVHVQGYEKIRAREAGFQLVYLDDPAGRIIIDTITRRTPQPFEGRTERLDFSIVDDHTIVTALDDLTVRIPTRALLLLFKLKAVWDRSQRLEAGTSADPEYEEGKLTKDYADVLALLDPARGGHDLDLDFLATRYARYPFLVDATRRLYRNPAGSERYGVEPGTARDWVERLLDLTTEGA